MIESLRQHVEEAARRPEVVAAVHEIYARLQLEVTARKPLCSASGKCCHFDAYGHRLYVTTVELAAFTHQLPGLEPAADLPKPANVLNILSPKPSGDCPHQIGNLCSVHSIRPFGCRIFYCDPSAAQWQQEQYERFHSELKMLHDQWKIPYFYVEWRQALAALKPREIIHR